MSILQAIILGIVQGLTEFLPISSSAHLALMEHYFNIADAGLVFDVLLHVGTLVALVAYFFYDWLEMFKAVLRPGRYNRFERRLFWYLVVATIPGAVVGFLLEKKAETIFRAPIRIAILLGIMGIILYLADRLARHQRRLQGITLTDAILIGLSQALAIMPGVSRSGSTMTTGLLLGFTRETAARFSFLMSTPIIFGAGLYHGLKLVKGGELTAFFTFPHILGFIAAVVSSYLTIKFLLSFLQRHTFVIFALYRIIIAIVVIIVEMLHIHP